jgi:hypothetical protein
MSRQDHHLFLISDSLAEDWKSIATSADILNEKSGSRYHADFEVIEIDVTVTKKAFAEWNEEVVLHLYQISKAPNISLLATYLGPVSKI